LAHIIACVLMTALGIAGRTGGEEQLADGIGGDLRDRGSTSAVTGVAASSAKLTLLMPSQGRTT